MRCPRHRCLRHRCPRHRRPRHAPPTRWRWRRLVEGFVSAEEAAHVISVGLPRMHRSLAGGRTESIRTSTTAMLPPHDPVVRRITERAAYLTGCAHGRMPDR
eukprot:719119-Prymnesium_polylepis.1